MDSFAVVVTACNNAAVLPNALRSVEEAVAFLRESGLPARNAQAEVVVVDDGSTDGTPEVVKTMTHAKDLYRLIRRARPSSPACARNVGAAASRGELLFFLDADDLYLPHHLHDCLRELADPSVEFVKTGVTLPAPVHPDWRQRIEHSVVINLCVRRRCHAAIGGFLDYHLFTREGDDFRHELDISWKLEDQYYTELLARLYRGVRVARETVRHLRYPGNSFDRQYEKFCLPFGAYREAPAPAERLRLQLCDSIFEYRLAALTTKLANTPKFI